MSDMVITFTVLGVAVVLFVWNKLPVEVVALLVALSLYFTQVLTLPQALAGFSDPTVVLIAGLFVVSMGLEASGITTWMGQQLVSRAGTSRIRLIVLMFAIVAVLGMGRGCQARQCQRQPGAHRSRRTQMKHAFSFMNGAAP